MLPGGKSTSSLPTGSPSHPCDRLEGGLQHKLPASDISYTYEIVESVTDARLVMRTAEGPFPMETSYECSNTAAGHTQMSLRNRGDPRGVSKLCALFMRGAMRQAMTKNIDAMKLRFEDG